MPTRQLSLHHFFIHRHHPQPRTRRRQRQTTRGRPGDTEGGTRWAYKVRPLFLFFIFYFTYFDSTPSSPNMFPSTENALTCHSCRPQLTRDVPHPPNMSPHPEHQNMPARARSGARAPPLSLSLISNTPPCLDHQNEPTRAHSQAGAHTPPLS